MTAKVSSWPYGKPFPPHDIEAKFAAAKARISELEEDLWAARTLNAPHLSTQFRNVTTVPTDEDVYVGAKCVGRILDCGDCYRVTPKDKRRKRFYREDYDTRDLAIAALTAPYRLRAGRRPRPPRAAQGRWMGDHCGDTSGEAPAIDPCVTARGFSHRCERGTFGCDRMHLPPEAVVSATLRAEVARLTKLNAAANAQADLFAERAKALTAEVEGYRGMYGDSNLARVTKERDDVLAEYKRLTAELAESKRAHEQRDEIDACSNRRIVDREAERVELVAMLERLATGGGVAYDFALDDARALLARLKGGG